MLHDTRSKADQLRCQRPVSFIEFQLVNSVKPNKTCIKERIVTAKSKLSTTDQSFHSASLVRYEFNKRFFINAVYILSINHSHGQFTAVYYLVANRC